MKLISFTVPCYNSADYMHICLDSLLTGGDRVEIIIIDDGSTDSTGAIADAYAAKHPDIIRVIHQENGGHGEGINQGLKHATCPYFKVVDSDDWVNAVALQHVLNRLEQLEAEGGVDLMVCNYVYEHEDRSLLSTIRYKNVFPENQVIGWEGRSVRISPLPCTPPFTAPKSCARAASCCPSIFSTRIICLCMRPCR